jgi:hypothetical protein
MVSKATVEWVTTVRIGDREQPKVSTLATTYSTKKSLQSSIDCFSSMKSINKEKKKHNTKHR